MNFFDNLIKLALDIQHLDELDPGLDSELEPLAEEELEEITREWNDLDLV
jgi:hypothetical protein